MKFLVVTPPSIYQYPSTGKLYYLGCWWYRITQSPSHQVYQVPEFKVTNLTTSIVTYVPYRFIPHHSATLPCLAILPYGQAPNMSSTMWVSIFYP